RDHRECPPVALRQTLDDRSVKQPIPHSDGKNSRPNVAAHGSGVRGLGFAGPTAILSHGAAAGQGHRPCLEHPSTGRRPMPTTTAPFRADMVGSLLRTAPL